MEGNQGQHPETAYERWSISLSFCHCSYPQKQSLGCFRQPLTTGWTQAYLVNCPVSCPHFVIPCLRYNHNAAISKPVPLKDTSINEQLSPPAIYPYTTICMTDIKPGFVCEHHGVPVCTSELQMIVTPVHSSNQMSPCQNLPAVQPIYVYIGLFLESVSNVLSCYAVASRHRIDRWHRCINVMDRSCCAMVAQGLPLQVRSLMLPVCVKCRASFFVQPKNLLTANAV